VPQSESADPDQKDDSRFLFKKPHGEPDFGPRRLISQYLSVCHDIIVESKGKSILILSRANNIAFGVTKKDFSGKLRNCLPSDIRSRFDKDIRVTTAHSAKGQEADVVIILRAINGQFPLIHPDGQLFQIFGLSPKDTLDEERRLFYVACSRAKTELFLLAEEGNLSDFFQKNVSENKTRTQTDLNLDDEIPF